MQRAIEVEEKVSLALTVNFDEVCNEIIEKLSMLRDCPNRLENPLIYHLVSLSTTTTEIYKDTC
jgi:DNA polymerase epsilon subunit 1